MLQDVVASPPPREVVLERLTCFSCLVYCGPLGQRLIASKHFLLWGTRGRGRIYLVWVMERCRERKYVCGV